MKKYLIISISLAIVLTMGILEQGWISSTFTALENRTKVLIEKCDNETLKKEDVDEVCEWWQKKKETVHIYIRHDVIANFDYYLSAASANAEMGDFYLALPQLRMLLDAAISVPKSFKFAIENIL